MYQGLKLCGKIVCGFGHLCMYVWGQYMEDRFGLDWLSKLGGIVGKAAMPASQVHVG